MPEIIERLEGIEQRSLSTFSSAEEMYSFASDHVGRYRQGVVDDCLARMQEPVTERKFFMEYLWCVYVSGFSARTISAKYDALLRAHLILSSDGEYFPVNNCYSIAHFPAIYSIFKNRSKAKAVQATRLAVHLQGWPAFRKKYIDPKTPEILAQLPNIGPALSVHLARNLGNLDLVKPDIHLTRLSEKYGFLSVRDMCKAISDESLAKTDLILWLASVDHGTK